MGVLHGDEIEYVFGHPLNASGPHTVAEQSLSRKVMGYFSRFARTGYDFHFVFLSLYLFSLLYLCLLLLLLGQLSPHSEKNISPAACNMCKYIQQQASHICMYFNTGNLCLYKSPQCPKVLCVSLWYTCKAIQSSLYLYSQIDSVSQPVSP